MADRLPNTDNTVVVHSTGPHVGFYRSRPHYNIPSGGYYTAAVPAISHFMPLAGAFHWPRALVAIEYSMQPTSVREQPNGALWLALPD